MVNIFYFVTTLTDALSFADKNVLFDFTYFNKRQDAIKGALSLRTSNVPLVGKLELSDETKTPNQVNPDYWTQVGYNISSSEKNAQQYRLKFRRKHLSRISVIPWDKMQQDISEKVELYKKVVMGAQEIMDYDNDRKQDYDGIVANEQDKNEAFELSRKFGEIVSKYDLLRKSHGLTRDEEENLYLARTTAIEFLLQLYGAEARRYVSLAREAVLPEVELEYTQKAAQAFIRFRFLEDQQAATSLMRLQERGLLPKIPLVEFGRDEMSQISAGETTLDELGEKQRLADGLPPPEDEPRIWLPEEI